MWHLHIATCVLAAAPTAYLLVETMKAGFVAKALRSKPCKQLLLLG
jgi:hypothetical protein